MFRLKSGDMLTGTIVEVKNDTYTIATDIGRVTLNQEKIESITEKR